jgi:hypothetical protein
VSAYLELDLEQLPEEIPKGFEQRREEVLSFAKEEPLENNKIPDEGKTPLYCDLCDMTFDHKRDAFALRLEHRMEVHGSKEGPAPLPEL